MTVKNPKEISKDQYDRDQQISKWVSTMFSFLFGDGVIQKGNFNLSFFKNIKLSSSKADEINSIFFLSQYFFNRFAFKTSYIKNDTN